MSPRGNYQPPLQLDPMFHQAIIRPVSLGTSISISYPLSLGIVKMTRIAAD